MTPRSSVENNIKIKMTSSDGSVDDADTVHTGALDNAPCASEESEGFSEFLKVLHSDSSTGPASAGSAKKPTESVRTEDSWGGEQPLPELVNSVDMTAPTKFPKEAFVDDEEDLSDPDEPGVGKQNGGQASAAAPPQAVVTRTTAKAASIHGQPSGSDMEDLVNYINFDKYLTKNSANYYYSQKNKNVRDKLDMVKSTHRHASLSSIDDSTHGKVSILLERQKSSSYKGPLRLRSDGSLIKPAVKSRRGSSLSANVSVGSSVGNNSVTFSTVQFREHERIAGDNPCVTSGVPLSIGWGSVQHNAVDLDLYERSKGPSRDKIEMMVPATVRKSMLRDEFGVSVKELNEAIKSVNIAKRNRRHTVAGEHMEGWGEGIESAKRKLGRFIKKTSNEKEEKKLWEKAQKVASKSK